MGAAHLYQVGVIDGIAFVVNRYCLCEPQRPEDLDLRRAEKVRRAMDRVKSGGGQRTPSPLPCTKNFGRLPSNPNLIAVALGVLRRTPSGPSIASSSFFRFEVASTATPLSRLTYSIHSLQSVGS